MGFGEQPFGDKRFEYSSQAPFHMGFYHEASIVYAAGGFIKRTLPEYRMNQFLTLARFAFKTGHPYWGYRFAGWGLHFVQDLTQPYHTTLLPGVGTTRMLWINIISKIGLDGSKNAMIKRVGHTGGDPGVRTFMYYDTKEKVGIILFMNTELKEAELKNFKTTVYDEIFKYALTLRDNKTSR